MNVYILTIASSVPREGRGLLINSPLLMCPVIRQQYVHLLLWRLPLGIPSAGRENALVRNDSLLDARNGQSWQG